MAYSIGITRITEEWDTMNEEDRAWAMAFSRTRTRMRNYESYIDYREWVRLNPKAKK